MPMICGSLDRIEEDIRGTRWIYVKTTVSGERSSEFVSVLGGRPWFYGGKNGLISLMFTQVNMRR